MMASYCLDFSVILDTNIPNTCIICGHVKGKGLYASISSR